MGETEPTVCAICLQPEGTTHYGTFTTWRDEPVHRGCLLDRDSDMADTYTLGAGR
jgi:hypothetical protein